MEVEQREGRRTPRVARVSATERAGAPEPLTDTLGATLCGASGAGKTTTARCWSDIWDGVAITFNLDHEPKMGHTVESLGGLKQALAEGRERIDVRPPVEEIEEPELFEEVVRYLLELGNQLREADPDRKVLFLMDEAQDLQERWVKVAMKRLRKRHIKPVAMTQDPVSLSNRIRTVADYNAWLSPPTSKLAENMAGLGYPVELLQELPQYDCLVLGERWEPVARFRAPEEYAE